MQYRPQGDSIWGTIHTCVEIATGVYAVGARDRNGMEQEGIMVRKSRAEAVFSEKAVTLGQESGGWLCYGENSKDIPIYEVLQRRMANCKRIENSIIRQMEEIRRDGRLALTDYFGECEKPKETPDGWAEAVLRIRNGIYMLRDGSGRKLAVHEAVADNFMTPMAAGYGSVSGEYLFYDLDGSVCAVALNELKNVFQEAAEIVVCEDSLYATLHRDFADYTAFYNLCMPQQEQIPETDAAADCYLGKIW